jgi:hypothetical protein
MDRLYKVPLQLLILNWVKEPTLNCPFFDESWQFFQDFGEPKTRGSFDSFFEPDFERKRGSEPGVERPGRTQTRHKKTEKKKTEHPPRSRRQRDVKKPLWGPVPGDDFNDDRRLLSRWRRGRRLCLAGCAERGRARHRHCPCCNARARCSRSGRSRATPTPRSFSWYPSPPLPSLSLGYIIGNLRLLSRPTVQVRHFKSYLFIYLFLHSFFFSFSISLSFLSFLK